MTFPLDLDPATAASDAPPPPNHPDQHPPIPHTPDTTNTLRESPQPPLDNAEQLDLATFPNLAARAKTPIATIPNVEHLLTSYGISCRYNVIKKRLEVDIPGLSGAADNAGGVALAHVTSLASLNSMPTGQLANFRFFKIA